MSSEERSSLSLEIGLMIYVFKGNASSPTIVKTCFRHPHVRGGTGKIALSTTETDREGTLPGETRDKAQSDKNTTNGIQYNQGKAVNTPRNDLGEESRGESFIVLICLVLIHQNVQGLRVVGKLWGMIRLQFWFSVDIYGEHCEK
uniref:Uncharacterized protein n=1 Tax=Timema bartmani TaxID=61472 RepID=A0A7R9I4G4_9NEOP|nr:unnamed protein product [Timema bartmani]